MKVGGPLLPSLSSSSRLCRSVFLRWLTARESLKRALQRGNKSRVQSGDPPARGTIRHRRLCRKCIEAQTHPQGLSEAGIASPITGHQWLFYSGISFKIHQFSINQLFATSSVPVPGTRSALFERTGPISFSTPACTCTESRRCLYRCW